jgi:23S rRNA (cytosine1962-C5)-methyltransferase
MITVRLKRGREGPVRAGHPWVFSGAIDRITGEGAPGALVHVVTAEEHPIGVGYYNPLCSIAVRLLTRTFETIDSQFIFRRLTSALALRQAILPPQTTGYRLVNGEGDFLPGVVVDVYGDFVVCQFLTAGAEALKPLIVDELASLLAPRGIYEKSEGAVRKEEGLPNAAGVLWGQEPPPLVTIEEYGCHFGVHLQGGQKTGFFLDQRENRALFGSLAHGKTVLNGFSYSGGFGVYAARHDATHVVSVDASAPAIQLARQNWQLNHLPASQGTFIQADMFTYLREASKPFDLIVLDPPPFIRRRQDLQAGMKGYKEIHLQALRQLPPGGQLLSFSCSQHLSVVDFLQTIQFAAADTGRSIQLLKHLGPGPDHPTNLAHVEGTYLKGVWLRVGP